MRLTIILLAASLFAVTALISVTALAFKANSLIVYNDAWSLNGRAQIITIPKHEGPNAGMGLALYPAWNHFVRGPVAATIASACLSVAVAIVLLGICGVVFRRGGPLLVTYGQRRWLYLALGVNIVLSISVGIINLIHHLQSDKFDPDYRSPVSKDILEPSMYPWPMSKQHEVYGPSDEYDGGRFDLASWSCQLRKYRSFNDGGDILGRQCVDETAALWLGVVVVVLSLCMAGLVFVDWKKWRALMSDYRDKKREGCANDM